MFQWHLRRTAARRSSICCKTVFDGEPACDYLFGTDRSHRRQQSIHRQFDRNRSSRYRCIQSLLVEYASTANLADARANARCNVSFRWLMFCLLQEGHYKRSYDGYRRRWRYCWWSIRRIRWYCWNSNEKEWRISSDSWRMRKRNEPEQRLIPIWIAYFRRGSTAADDTTTFPNRSGQRRIERIECIGNDWWTVWCDTESAKSFQSAVECVFSITGCEYVEWSECVGSSGKCIDQCRRNESRIIAEVLRSVRTSGWFVGGMYSEVWTALPRTDCGCEDWGDTRSLRGWMRRRHFRIWRRMRRATLIRSLSRRVFVYSGRVSVVSLISELFFITSHRAVVCWRRC